MNRVYPTGYFAFRNHAFAETEPEFGAYSYDFLLFSIRPRPKGVDDETD